VSASCDELRAKTPAGIGGAARRATRSGRPSWRPTARAMRRLHWRRCARARRSLSPSGALGLPPPSSHALQQRDFGAPFSPRLSPSRWRLRAARPCWGRVRGPAAFLPRNRDWEGLGGSLAGLSCSRPPSAPTAGAVFQAGAWVRARRFRQPSAIAAGRQIPGFRRDRRRTGGAVSDWTAFGLEMLGAALGRRARGGLWREGRSSPIAPSGRCRWCPVRRQAALQPDLLGQRPGEPISGCFTLGAVATPRRLRPVGSCKSATLPEQGPDLIRREPLSGQPRKGPAHTTPVPAKRHHPGGHPTRIARRPGAA